MPLTFAFMPAITKTPSLFPHLVIIINMSSYHHACCAADQRASGKKPILFPCENHKVKVVKELLALFPSSLSLMYSSQASKKRFEV